MILTSNQSAPRLGLSFLTTLALVLMVFIFGSCSENEPEPNNTNTNTDPDSDVVELVEVFQVTAPSDWETYFDNEYIIINSDRNETLGYVTVVPGLDYKLMLPDTVQFESLIVNRLRVGGPGIRPIAFLETFFTQESETMQLESAFLSQDNSYPNSREIEIDVDLCYGSGPPSTSIIQGGRFVTSTGVLPLSSYEFNDYQSTLFYYKYLDCGNAYYYDPNFDPGTPTFDLNSAAIPFDDKIQQLDFTLPVERLTFDNITFTAFPEPIDGIEKAPFKTFDLNFQFEPTITSWYLDTDNIKSYEAKIQYRTLDRDFVYISTTNSEGSAPVFPELSSDMFTIVDPNPEQLSIDFNKEISRMYFRYNSRSQNFDLYWYGETNSLSVDYQTFPEIPAELLEQVPFLTPANLSNSSGQSQIPVLNVTIEIEKGIQLDKLIDTHSFIN